MINRKKGFGKKEKVFWKTWKKGFGKKEKSVLENMKKGFWKMGFEITDWWGFLDFEGFSVIIGEEY